MISGRSRSSRVPLGMWTLPGWVWINNSRSAPFPNQQPFNFHPNYLGLPRLPMCSLVIGFPLAVRSPRNSSNEATDRVAAADGARKMVIITFSSTSLSGSAWRLRSALMCRNSAQISGRGGGRRNYSKHLLQISPDSRCDGIVCSP